MWALLPALVALVTFANAVPNGFALDDIDLVQRNPRIAALSSLPHLFVEPYWPGSPDSGLHRPVTIASYAINRAISGPGPMGFHIGNVLLHGLACFLAWQVGRRIGLHYGTALACGLLFAAHPLHAEAVANVAGRAELLAAVGVLTAWLCHQRSTEHRSEREGPDLRWGFLAALFFLGAILSKEHAIMAPLVFLVDDRHRPGQAGSSQRMAWKIYAGYAGALTVAAGLRYQALGGFRGAETTAFLDNPAAFGGTLTRIATAVWVQVKYVALFLWPGDLSSDYSFDAIPVVDSVGDPRLWLGLGLIALALAAFGWAWGRSRPLAVGVACWVAFFLPSSNLLFSSGTVMAERLAYLPSLGGCLIAGHLLASLASKRSVLPAGRLRIAVPIALVLVLTAALGVRAGLRNPAWRDNATLARLDAETHPRSAKLQAGAGIASAAAGDGAAAEESFRRAIAIYPDYAQVRFNLGQLLMHRGESAEAIEHLAHAVTVSPGNPRPYKSLAPLYEQAGDRDRALEAYEAGARLDPSDLPFRFNHGRALLASGRTADGLAVLTALAETAPNSVSGMLARALSHDARRETEQAAAIYRDLLRRGDLSPGIRQNISRRLAPSPERP